MCIVSCTVNYKKGKSYAAQISARINGFDVGIVIINVKISSSQRFLLGFTQSSDIILRLARLTSLLVCRCFEPLTQADSNSSTHASSKSRKVCEKIYVCTFRVGAWGLICRGEGGGDSVPASQCPSVPLCPRISPCPRTLDSTSRDEMEAIEGGERDRFMIYGVFKSLT
ncbi:hypothetical protein E2C01_029128 [Portunus trituberculatus]|uniref:Uncharacterized protein n=1 Tax=Portunus trituberculatus TaxID=210409 RepID=A0A5B7ERF2_PORTR|nr:hypothetical protein [Portunus trituberculatus]